MKTIIAAIAVAVGIASVTLPASADVIDYGSSWKKQAFNNGY